MEKPLPWDLPQEPKPNYPICREIYSYKEARSLRVVKEVWHYAAGPIESIQKQLATTTSMSLFALPEGPGSVSRCPLVTYRHTTYEDGSVHELLSFDAINPHGGCPFVTVSYGPDGKRHISSGEQGLYRWWRLLGQMGFDRYPEDFPEDIDYDATLTGFYTQVEEKNFANPVVVLPGIN